MIRRTSRVGAHALFTLPALFISATLVLGFSGPSMAEQPLRIGASMSLTGKYKLTGGYGREGYLLCQKHTNDKGGVLGRPIEFVIYDDGSDEKTAVSLYEKLITVDNVDTVIGPYSSPITDAVADITEKHQRVMLAPMAAANSLWEKGRKYLVMVPSPLESASQGVLDVAARNGLKSVALINEDGVVAKSIAKGASELVKKKGLQLVLHEAYPKGTADFSDILKKVKAAKPDVLVAASLLEDAIAINRQMKDLDVNVKMVGSSPYGGLPDYYKALGKSAEFVYSDSFWDPRLPTPGNREFVAAYEKEFNRPPALQSANAYAGCQLLVEAARLAGTMDSGKLRETFLTLKTRTILGDFAIDARGLQIAHKSITTQWQDGKQVVVWPDELASGKARFPAM
jgi:branched-chain amino acid transport system substrate-binding protein